MHIVNDENGNPIPHGGHDHAHDHHHDHEHGHDGCEHSHHCGHCDSGNDGCKDETLALLSYMLQHNEHHAAEIDEMAARLEKDGMADVAKQMKEGVTQFQKGNLYLSLALSLYKEHLKEA